MKFNIITLLIAFAIAALIGYGLFAANGAEGDKPLVVCLCGGIACFVTLAGAIAVRPKNEGRGSVANIRVLSALFFVVILIEQIIFSFVPFHLAPYIIVTGVLFMVYVLIAYAIGKALQNA